MLRSSEHSQLSRRKPSAAFWVSWVLLSGVGVTSCGPEGESAGPLETMLPFEAASPSLSRLTEAQFHNSMQDLLGPEVVLTIGADPDIRVSGFFAVGARENSLSRFGVQQAEAASYDGIQQALASDSARARLIPCTPAGAVDDACLRMTIATFGRRAWRRPLVDDELSAFATLGGLAAERLSSFDAGVEFALAAVLQSPQFLYRVELGAPTDGGERRYTAYEMASRLSYFIWNTTPDDALLDAAGAGVLDTDAGLAEQATRLLDSPRARTGARAFFTEVFELDRLDGLTKDPELFTHFSPELGGDAREETLRLIEHWTFDEQGDYRDLLTTRMTFLSRKLASIYNVRAPREDWGRYEFSAGDQRRGLLGHASFLALQSHPRGTSATLRGMFVRRAFLCDIVPAPPVDVDTSLPEPSGMTLTLRDRVQEHLTNPSCSGCHRPLDMIGLAFENYDAIGAYRMDDHGATIDATGELDGLAFEGPVEFAEVLSRDSRVGACLVRQMVRYAMGNVEEYGQQGEVRALQRLFEESGFRVRDLMFDIAMSRMFRVTGEVE